MQSNTTCQLVEQYLGYLTVIKGRANNTVKEYRTDLFMFFNYIMNLHNITIIAENFAQADLKFIKSITLHNIYSFISYCKKSLNSSPGTRARKIVSIRQFWKYLKTKAHLIDNNIAEELETPKLPKRIPKDLNLEKSVRLLLECNNSPRDHYIITIFLNCALRLSELVILNIDQVNNDILSVVGKGTKERKIFLTPAAKKAFNDWLQIRNSIAVNINALFISKNNNHITTTSIQNIIKNILFLLDLTQNVYQHTNFVIQQLLLCINMVEYISAPYSKFLVMKVLL